MNKTMQFLQNWSLGVCVLLFLGGGTANAAEGKILTDAELKQILSEELYIAKWHTYKGYREIDYYSPDGNFSSLAFSDNKGQEEQSKGTYKVENDQVCIERQDTVIGGDSPAKQPYNRCYKWRQLGDRKFEWWETGGASEGFSYVLGD